MGPYSHTIIAHQLQKTVNPTDLQAYYWGTVAPDVRYLVPGMKRNQTHIPAGQILNYRDQYPQLADFLQGYLVHCLTDQLDILKIIQAKFPFNIQKDPLSLRQGSVILEFFNILRTRPNGRGPSGGNNAVLRKLGVGDHQAETFAREVNRYVTAPNIKATITLYQALGFTVPDQIEKYRDAAAKFQRNWLQKNLILFGLQVGKVNQEIATEVQSAYEWWVH